LENDNLQQIEEEKDTDLTISEETLAIIVKMAVTDVEGVAGMSTTLTEELAEAFGKKSELKGIKVEIGQNSVTVNLSVIMKFGYRIPDVAWHIQEKVRKDIMAMTEFEVESINVYVQGIDFS